MPKVTLVKKAQKNVPGTDIKKGESYYWWKFRHGGKRTSKTPPKPSQLTQSDFWGAIYSLQESNENGPGFEEIESSIDDIKSELEGIADETDDKFNNMPDGLQQGDTGQMLEERAQAVRDAIDALDGIDTTIDLGDVDADSEEADELKANRAQEIWDEVTSALGDISCS